MKQSMCHTRVRILDLEERLSCEAVSKEDRTPLDFRYRNKLGRLLQSKSQQRHASNAWGSKRGTVCNARRLQPKPCGTMMCLHCEQENFSPSDSASKSLQTISIDMSDKLTRCSCVATIIGMILKVGYARGYRASRR